MKGKDFFDPEGIENLVNEAFANGGIDEIDEEEGENESENTIELSEIDQLKAEVAEWKDKFIRTFAELENARKRAMKEKLDIMATANRDTMAALLPIVDDFDRAMKNEEFSEGMQLLYNKFHNTLKNKGLTVMESNGTEFTAELHEAITEIPAPTEEMKGKIIDTVEKGYFLNEKIIRHAKVVVGK